MLRPFLLRKVGIAICLLLALSAPLVAKAPSGAQAPSAAASRPASTSLWPSVWKFLSRFWSEVSSVAPTDGRLGDQNPIQVPPENLDGGCSVDPYGRCLPGS
jgi:hypothetical protein